MVLNRFKKLAENISRACGLKQAMNSITTYCRQYKYSRLGQSMTFTVLFDKRSSHPILHFNHILVFSAFKILE